MDFYDYVMAELDPILRRSLTSEAYERFKRQLFSCVRGEGQLQYIRGLANRRKGGERR